MTLITAVQQTTIVVETPLYGQPLKGAVSQLIKIQTIGPRGYSWEYSVGLCRLVLQILTLFHTRFQTRPLKSIPVFRPGLQSEIMLSFLRLEHKHKDSSNSFRFSIFFFLSYSFGIETIKTFIHSRSSPENHTRFQTKMGKVYTRFQTKTAQNPYPMGRHVPHSLYKGVPPSNWNRHQTE